MNLMLQEQLCKRLCWFWLKWLSCQTAVETDTSQRGFLGDCLTDTCDTIKPEEDKYIINNITTLRYNIKYYSNIFTVPAVFTLNLTFILSLNKNWK